MYELFTGQRAFKADTPLNELVSLRSSGTVVAPTAVARTINPQVNQAILACLEPDPAKRTELLQSAERLLMDEMPIIPIYYYVSRNMVRPRVRGFYNNLQDLHPLSAIWIDPNVDDKTAVPNEFMRPAP